MPETIGYAIPNGDPIRISSPQEIRALQLFAQLQAWRAKGFDPQLFGSPDGWILLLDSEKWNMGGEINERSRRQLMRFCTERFDTPEAAIEAALKVIQP